MLAHTPMGGTKDILCQTEMTKMVWEVGKDATEKMAVQGNRRGDPRKDG